LSLVFVKPTAEGSSLTLNHIARTRHLSQYNSERKYKIEVTQPKERRLLYQPKPT